MALDDVILECRSKNSVPNTVRFLQFKSPAVLVGYHQDVEHEVRLEYVKSNNIEINRRITGGGAIFFDRSSLGWEIIASKDSLHSYSTIEELFRIMCKGTIYALEIIGVEADFRPKNDIEVNGRKISGTGGVERGEAFLFQGTLLVDLDVQMIMRALRIPIEKLKDKEIRSVKDRMTCIRQEIDIQPSIKEIKSALKIGFEKALNIKLANGGLTSHENSLLKKRLPAFQSDEWIYLDRRPINEAALVHAVNKTPGGLIRVSLALDRGANIIKSILVTGDFFAFPSRAIFDLEAALKFTVCSKEEIKNTVHDFFKSKPIHIPGVASVDLVNLILEAVEKTSYESFGITLEETNHIYPITKHSKSLLNTGCDFLLLPYCAKPPSCEFRSKEGCSKCGECSVGKAYEWANNAGLKTVTIQSFKHLIRVLEMMKDNGAKGYIGCCCEAFYCKHRDELESTGVPGIIIDIDDKTCYDLGKEEDAYEGKYEAQTYLKLELLSKLLNCINRKTSKAKVTGNCATLM
jgi:lipoate-protein ligase A